MAVSTMVTPPGVKLRSDGRPMPLRQETLKKTLEPVPTMDRDERSSFASFKEDRGAVAQSFLDSPISSYALQCDNAIDDDSEFDTSNTNSGAASPISATSSNPVDELVAQQKAKEKAEMGTKVLATPLTNPATNLHAFVCPADGFRGWKEIPVHGRLASRSFSDLRIFNNQGFTWEPKPIRPAPKRTASRFAPGDAPFEKMPVEILNQILDHLVVDIPPNGLQPRNIDLMSLLLTSRAMHSTTLATLYKQVTIPHSTVFRKLLNHMKEFPALGTMVRRLDFSHFNNAGTGITARQRAETQNLTAQTLLECLKMLPNLHEFLAQELIVDELSAPVLRELFLMPHLRALDFCAASNSAFKESMLSVVRSPVLEELPEFLPIRRISFHECTALPALVYETIIPRLKNLTILDVCHTRITDKALMSIPQTAKLTHLNISKCQLLTGDGVVEFFKTHDSVKNLVYLNLHMDSKSFELLDAEHLRELLQVLPPTLKYLNLKGSAMDKSHLPLLEPFTKHVEELGFGRWVDYVDIKHLLRKPEDDDEKALAAWVPHELRYIDISDMALNQIDFSQLFGRTTNALDARTLPLEVIEVQNNVYTRFQDRERMFKKQGWLPKDGGGKRGWLVRDLSGDKDHDDGSRYWKMGATYWGMRKVPVAQAEVGGMYGMYMFKR